MLSVSLLTGQLSGGLFGMPSNSKWAAAVAKGVVNGVQSLAQPQITIPSGGAFQGAGATATITGIPSISAGTIYPFLSVNVKILCKMPGGPTFDAQFIPTLAKIGDHIGTYALVTSPTLMLAGPGTGTIAPIVINEMALASIIEQSFATADPSSGMFLERDPVAFVPIPGKVIELQVNMSKAIAKSIRQNFDIINSPINVIGGAPNPPPPTGPLPNPAPVNTVGGIQ